MIRMIWNTLTVELFHVPLFVVFIVLRWWRLIVGFLSRMTGAVK